MKGIVPLVLALLHLGQVRAQPSIERDLLAPFGLVASLYTIPDPSTLPMIGDGAEQVWDFSNTSFSELGTMHFRKSAGTPYANAFPLADWALAQTFTGQGTLYQYLRITQSGLQMYGRNIPYNPIMYQVPTTILKFPMAFDESFLDEYINEGGPNSRVWTYSGHGTILSPLGTFHNVAKVGNSLGDIILWNLEPLYPIFYLEEGSIYVCKLLSINTDVGIGEVEAAAWRAWPNPCQDVLHLSGLQGRAQWKVVDTQGRTLSVGEGFVDTGLELDVSMLAQGTYLLLVEQVQTRRTVPFVKE